MRAVPICFGFGEACANELRAWACRRPPVTFHTPRRILNREGRAEVVGAATPLHSIVFVTKRPGGYDVLLEALARQSSRNYELICVDELADHRAHAVKEMAARLQVNLAAITRSKPKTHPETRFGIANAINTGLDVFASLLIATRRQCDDCWLCISGVLTCWISPAGFILAKGHVVTVLQDNIYLPDFFVERTLHFHSENPEVRSCMPPCQSTRCFARPLNNVIFPFRDHGITRTTHTGATLIPRAAVCGASKSRQHQLPEGPLFCNCLQ